MQDNGKHTLIDCFIAVAPYLNQLSTSDIAGGIVEANTKEILTYIPGETIDHKVKAGEISPDDTIFNGDHL